MIIKARGASLCHGRAGPRGRKSEVPYRWNHPPHTTLHAAQALELVEGHGGGGQRREFGSHQSTECHCNDMEAGVSSRRRMSAEEKSSDGDRNLHLGMFHSIPGLYALDLSLQTFPSVLGEGNITSRSEPLAVENSIKWPSYYFIKPLPYSTLASHPIILCSEQL